jgi:hypothetical protein
MGFQPVSPAARGKHKARRTLDFIGFRRVSEKLDVPAGRF